MIDFAGLVLAPAMAVFGRPISVTPLASQPGVSAYPARGIYALKPVQILLEDGTVQSTNQPTLGIRLPDFAVAPKQQDLVAFDLGSFVVTDVVPDGQGGADMVLRKGP